MCSIGRAGAVELLILSVVVCVLLAKWNDGNGLGKLAAFFTVIGDVLALFAIPDSSEGTAED